MNRKKCFVCKKIKQINDFYVHKGMADGHLNICKECKKEYTRNRDNREIDRNRYRNNVKRYLYCRYRDIVNRCTGKYGHASYKGRDFLSKKEWDIWCNDTKDDFMALYNAWKENEYDRKLAPSIDRIDNNKGYIRKNIRWITQSKNSKKSTK